MSLKAFHLVFILASIILSGWFGSWCLEAYSDRDQTGYLVAGIASIAGGLGLIAYLFWFLKKSRGIGYLALLPLGFFFSLESAWACAVCLGDSNSLMVKSANSAVSFLLGVVVAVLVAFAGLFIFWGVRAYRIDKEQNEITPSRLA